MLSTHKAINSHVILHVPFHRVKIHTCTQYNGLDILDLRVTFLYGNLNDVKFCAKEF